ncbi:ABC transporter ATP-binding protein [Candidatus Thiodictyon syntrophicum]|jgi:branched-chain amino acid transport system ATP-binding protein|uniref:High-affinity branched-chain amino acid transport ATP-binding protein n=1 Tax=Candidatus Thiodictyon syntrophicum TaxID=1166950 RepID=A0A2K8UBJ8_9GAMM|nr:ABC transporter ATP-binding protein [Candidatus Thiodictyon syntrophicum]AUB82907.1 ABC transporter ATP-binding protein [Candidatus Thiodictyon syntrophicum]
MSLLEVQGLEVHYGGIRALKGIDLAVTQGEVVCLIGANGAGKTTTMRALAGLLPAAAGTIRYAGSEVTGLPVHRRARLGISLVPEGRGVFPRLTVAENLQMGAYFRTDMAGIAADLARVYGLFPRLEERRAQTGGTLSGGEQQMLAIARALMSRPRLLLLDEPSMGLAPLAVQTIFATIRLIADQGMTLLLVEQNARLALEVSGRGYVLEGGLIVHQDAAAALLASPKVRAAYLGA